MGIQGSQTGFTIVEVIVTVAIVGLFAGLLFQTFMSNTSQQTIVVQRAAADDIALNNLKKITSRSSSLLTSLTCISTNPDSSKINDLTKKSDAVGTSITFTPEPITATSLPLGTTQKIVALYPRGCAPAGTVPIEIKSTVTLTTPHGTETVTRAAYIN